jgi:hypothetical protein
VLEVLGLRGDGVWAYFGGVRAVRKGYERASGVEEGDQSRGEEQSDLGSRLSPPRTGCYCTLVTTVSTTLSPLPYDLPPLPVLSLSASRTG